ncbi:MAG: hypothetical protein AAGJ32_11990 [Pseudomonadota bacterium]
MGDPYTISLREAASTDPLFVRPRLNSRDLLAYFWLAKWWMLAIAIPVLVVGQLWAQSVQPQQIARAQLLVAEDGRPVSRDVLRFEAEQILSRSRAPSESIATALPQGALTIGVQRNRSALLLTLDGQRVDDPVAVLEGLVSAHLGDSQTARSSAEAPNSSLSKTSPTDADAPDAADALQTALAERQAFLDRHGLTDFDAERERRATALNTIDAALVNAEVRSASLARQLSALDRQLADTPQTLAADTGPELATEIEALRRERTLLLMRYTDQSVPVQTIDRQISALEARLAARPAAPGGATRSNPAYGALLADRNRVAIEADAAKAAVATLRQRRADAERGIATLAGLEPEWRRIAARVSRLQPSLSESDQAPGNASRIDGARGEVSIDGGARERALAGPIQSIDQAEATRRRLSIGSVLLAGFVALMTGIVFARTRKTFVTPNSAARTVNRPPIAAIPLRR